MGSVPFVARGQAPFQQYGEIPGGRGVTNDYSRFQAENPGRYGPYEGGPMPYELPDRMPSPQDQCQERDGRGPYHGPYDLRNEGPPPGREYDYRYIRVDQDPRFGTDFRYV
jgi:hypothetical protein